MRQSGDGYRTSDVPESERQAEALARWWRPRPTVPGRVVIDLAIVQRVNGDLMVPRSSCNNVSQLSSTSRQTDIGG
jgi:hypothetical protein